MYRFAKLKTKYNCSIEREIIDFLNFYDIPKENIVNVQFVDDNHATIIFDTKNSKFDGTVFDGTEYGRYGF